VRSDACPLACTSHSGQHPFVVPIPRARRRKAGVSLDWALADLSGATVVRHMDSMAPTLAAGVAMLREALPRQTRMVTNRLHAESTHRPVSQPVTGVSP
jgi:hypothetical protein